MSYHEPIWSRHGRVMLPIQVCLDMSRSKLAPANSRVDSASNETVTVPGTCMGMGEILMWWMWTLAFSLPTSDMTHI